MKSCLKKKLVLVLTHLRDDFEELLLVGHLRQLCPVGPADRQSLFEGRSQVQQRQVERPAHASPVGRRRAVFI